MSHRFRDRKILSQAIRTAATVLWVVSSAQAVAASSPEDPEENVKPGLESSIAQRTESEAVRVVYDPDTGRYFAVPIQKTPVLSAPVARGLVRSTEGLRVFKLENGGKGVRLDGRYQHTFMVRVKPDGSLETLCTDHSHGVEAFLKAGARAAKLEPQDK
jgi:hypothetical protein